MPAQLGPDALLAAARTGDLKTLAEAAAGGADFSIVEEPIHRNLLHLAIMYLNRETALWLATSDAARAAGLDLDTRSPWGEPASYEAAKRGMHDVCRALIEGGAQPRKAELSRTFQSETWLGMAADVGFPWLCEWLLDHGAVPNQRNTMGW